MEIGGYREKPEPLVYLRPDDSPEVEIRPPVAQSPQPVQTPGEFATDCGANRAEPGDVDSQNQHTHTRRGRRRSARDISTRATAGWRRPLVATPSMRRYKLERGAYANHFGESRSEAGVVRFLDRNETWPIGKSRRARRTLRNSRSVVRFASAGTRDFKKPIRPDRAVVGSKSSDYRATIGSKSCDCTATRGSTFCANHSERCAPAVPSSAVLSFFPHWCRPITANPGRGRLAPCDRWAWIPISRFAPCLSSPIDYARRPLSRVP